MKQITKKKKIAVLITGLLRCPNLENLINAIKPFDIYLSSYKEYEKVARKISENVLLYDESYVKNEI